VCAVGVFILERGRFGSIHDAAVTSGGRGDVLLVYKDKARLLEWGDRHARP
jgi:hypothetical protein